MARVRKTSVTSVGYLQVFVLTILCSLVACTPKKKAPEPLPIDVEMAGCSAVIDGPVCLIEGQAQIALWTKHPASTLRLLFGESPIEHTTASVQGGTLTKVHIRADSLGAGKTLSLTVQEGDREGHFRLSLQSWVTPEAIREVDSLRRAFRFDDATARLDKIDTTKDTTLEALVMGRRARMARAQGKTTEAIDFFRRAVELDEKAGRYSDEIRDRAALSFTLAEKNRFSDARSALAPWSAKAPSNPENRAMLHYHQGVIAHRAGDLRRALDDLRMAEESAERVDLSAMRLDAMEVRADVLRQLGRQAEARAVLTRIAESLPNDTDACRRAGLFTNIGWNLLDEPSPSKESPQAFFERAIDIYRAKCPDSSLLANALTNVARVFVQRESFDEASRILVEARKAQPSPGLTLAAEQLELQAFIEFGQARGHTARIKEALGHFEQLGQLAQDAALWDARWIAALGKAQCFEALRDFGNARASYADAERMLDESSLLAPLGEGRNMYLEKRASSARRYLELLVREKDRHALRVARRSRARNLASLARWNRAVALDPEQRRVWENAVASYRSEREALDEEVSQRWTLSKSRLEESTVDAEKRAARLRSLLDHAITALSWGKLPNNTTEPTVPAEGELFLVYHPLTERRWVGLVETHDGWRAHVVDDLNLDAKPDELAVLLLEPFRREIEKVKKIRVFASAPLDAVDFHALAWDGEPLLHHASVVYGVDVDLDGPRREPTSPGALFIVDPRGDLPGARAEGQWAAKQLAQNGIRVDVLQGDQATYGAVRDALEKPDHALLHHAGHGLFRGHDGFASALPLAAEGEFGVGDVLALRFVPPVVVLSGCDTLGTGLGLSQAFALVGARVVIAAPRRVDDAVTEQLMRAFFVHWLKSRDATEALRRGQLELRQKEARADWAGFRVIVP